MGTLMMHILDVEDANKHPHVSLASLGGTFRSPANLQEQREKLGQVKHGGMRIFASKEYTPEIAEDEQLLRNFEEDEVGAYLSLDECGWNPGSDEDYWEEVEAQDAMRRAAVIVGRGRIREILKQETGRGKAIIDLLVENPGLITAVYALTRSKPRIAGWLPKMVAGLVWLFGRQKVINSLANQNFDGNLSALYRLKRFAENELRLQTTNPNIRGVACGIIHELGLDKTPKHTVRCAA